MPRKVTVKNFWKLTLQLKDLGDQGFGVPPQEAFCFYDQDSLARSFNGFRLACGWLENIRKRGTFNPSAVSDDLKSNVEEWARSRGCIAPAVSNGAFIAAAIYMGFSYQRIRKSPSARFNITTKLHLPRKKLFIPQSESASA